MEKLDLATLQRRFLSILNAEHCEIAPSLIDGREGPPISFSTRLGIYHTAVRLRFEESLGGDFSQVKAVLGEERFSTMVRAYLRAHPAHSPGLAELGKLLPQFLAQRQAAEWPELPYLAELASWEWKMILALWAQDAPPLDLAQMQALASQDPARLVLELHPSLQLMESAWQLDRLGTAQKLSKRDRVFLVTYRQGTSSYSQRLGAGAYRLLQELERGTPIGALGAFLKKNRLKEDQALRLISSWVEAGWIVHFRKTS